jgi:predicted Zn-dependent protease
MSFLPRIACLLCLCALLAGCATVPYTGRSQLNLLPDDQMLTMGIQSYGEVLSQSQVSSNAAATASLNEVGRRIAAAAEEFLREQGQGDQADSFQWQFTLIEDKTVNAWCMPGGKIAFYTGILPYTRDDDGMAVVMGHEVAHAVARHGNERMSQLLLAQLGAVALNEALREEPEGTRGLWLAAYGAGAQLGLILPYSRSQEYEADKIGLLITTKAGYDPRAAVPFWRRMMAQDKDSPPAFLSTHPATEDRIAEIEAMIPEAMDYGGRE